MKKLSNITESVWGDIRKRSTGETVRDEDKFNPDYIDFGENTTVYWAVDNLEIDGEVKFYFDDVKDYNNNGWRLPTVDEVYQLKWDNIRIPWYEGCKHLKFADGNELRLKTNGSGGFHMWTKELYKSFPTAAWSYGYNNSEKFGVDSFNKNQNRLYVFLVKDKHKINESVWGDIRKRSTGETIRYEDFGKTIEIDGIKYILSKEFWELGNEFEEDNSDEWTCFAFNKPKNGRNIISGNGEDVGVFGYNKWDIGEDKYDVYVLREYTEKSIDDLINAFSYNGNFIQMYGDEISIQDILFKYTKKIFEDNHMSEFAKYTIYEIIGQDWDFGVAIHYEEDGTFYDEDANPTLPPCELEGVDYDTVENIRIITYPMLDNWYENLRKELIDAYTKLGWTHLKEYELDFNNYPGNTEGLAFVKFKN